MRSLWSLVVWPLSLHLATALKFDLIAQAPHHMTERCIRNFVNKDTLVVVTAILDGTKGDGQVVDMHVRCHKRPFYIPPLSHDQQRGEKTDICRVQIKDSVGNEYGRPKDITGETRMAFTSLADTAFDVCFENTLTGSSRE